MATKKRHYRVTVYNMNSGLGKNGKPKETEEVTVCAKNQLEAESLAVSGGLICRENGWGAWDSVEVNEKGNEVNPKQAKTKKAKPEIWTVAWAEFDGWNSELYTGTQVFKSKEEAIAWVENDYNQELDDKFGQDPDDNSKPLKLNKKKIDGLDNQIDFPKCENSYRKWTINKSTL